MAIHVIEQDAFFAASIPLGDQQRALILPESRPVAAGDELYLRNAAGEFTWVADVQDVRQMAGPAALAGVADPEAQTYLIVGYLARIHPGTLPKGRANLKAPWVTLNSRTLPNALPWRPNGVLVYHHTLRLVDTVLTEEQLEAALAEGYVVVHRTQHYVTVTGDGRKRLLVQAFGVPMACSLCGAPLASMDDATLDHRIPTSQGGPDVLANLQLAHKRCNELKGNALPEQYPPLFAPPGSERSGLRRNGRAGRTRKRPAAAAPVLAAKQATAPADAVTDSAADGEAIPQQAAAGGDATPRQAAAKTTKRTAAKTTNAASKMTKAADSKTAKTTDSKTAKTTATKSAKTSARKMTKTAAKAGDETPASAAKSTAKKASPPAATAELVSDALVGIEAMPADMTEATPAAVHAADEAPTKKSTTRRATKAASNQPEVAVDAALTTAEAAAAAEQPEPTAAVTAPAVPEQAPAEQADADWLEAVSASGWNDLVKLAESTDWAARTATLRTMVQVRRSQSEPARQEGRLLAEATGPAGHYMLLDWNGVAVLCEESNEGSHMFQVPMLQSLTPAVYVWHLSEFGRRTPLQVAMHLRPFWTSGQPDGSGRVQARKGERVLVLGVRGDQLVECHWLETDPAVA